MNNLTLNFCLKWLLNYFHITFWFSLFPTNFEFSKILFRSINCKSINFKAISRAHSFLGGILGRIFKHSFGQGACWQRLRWTEADSNGDLWIGLRILSFICYVIDFLTPSYLLMLYRWIESLWWFSRIWDLSGRLSHHITCEVRMTVCPKSSTVLNILNVSGM